MVSLWIFAGVVLNVFPKSGQLLGQRSVDFAEMPAKFLRRQVWPTIEYNHKFKHWKLGSNGLDHPGQQQRSFWQLGDSNVLMHSVCAFAIPAQAI